MKKHHKIHHRNRDLTIQWYVQCTYANNTRDGEMRTERERKRGRELRERERERSKTTYQTPVMQIRIYTGDLRSINSGRFRAMPSCRSPCPRDATPNKSSNQKYTQSADPLRPPCQHFLFKEGILGEKIGRGYKDNVIPSKGEGVQGL